MENRFTIGQMAKLHNISVKTLRYYDEIDLFKPIEVDPDTGYRYYSVEQFKVLDIINYLKVLGMPLKEIKQHVTNRDLNDFMHTLNEYKVITEKKINDLLIAKGKIEERIKEFTLTQQIEQIAKPFVQQIDERQIVKLKEEITSLYDLEISLRKLNQLLNDDGSIFLGKVGLTISEQQFKRDSWYDYSSIFLILEEVEKENIVHNLDFVDTLPKGEYASIYFRGAHKEAKTYFHLLVDYLKEEHLIAKGDFLYRTIIDQFITKNEDEYLSVIQVLVETE